MGDLFRMPVRKVPKNYRNVTGLAAAEKSAGAAQFESTLERDFLALLEFSPEVERFEVQPLKIEWHDEHGVARTILDLVKPKQYVRIL